MSRDIDVALLRAFSAVVETGGVTTAARALNRTQAAVSLQIKRLETQLDCQLFARGNRRLELTASGERLLADAVRLVALNDDLISRITTPEFEGEIRFGVPTDIVRSYIPPVLKRFARDFPHVRLRLVTGTSSRLTDLYDRGALDLFLTTDAVGDGQGETLRIDKLVWVSAAGAGAHLTDPLPIAIGDTGCRFRPAILDALRLVGRKWRVVLAVNSQTAQDAAVSAGIAVSANLRDSVAAELVELGPDADLPLLPDYCINLNAPASGLNPVADAFVRTLRQEFIARFGAREIDRRGSKRAGRR